MKLTLPLFSLTTEEILSAGLKLANFDDDVIEKTNYKTNILRFRDNFYVDPSTIQNLFNDISDPQKCPVALKNVSPSDILYGLYYLKKYPTKHGLAQINQTHEKAALQKAHKMTTAFQSLKELKVNFFQ